MLAATTLARTKLVHPIPTTQTCPSWIALAQTETSAQTTLLSQVGVDLEMARHKTTTCPSLFFAVPTFLKMNLATVATNHSRQCLRTSSSSKSWAR